jgi:hypothetical protein
MRCRLALLCTVGSAALRVSPPRRALLTCGAAWATASSLPTRPACALRLSDLTSDEQEALDHANRDPALARTTPSGLKIIDVLTNEDGYAPTRDDRVFAHFKVWNSKGFRSGVPVDSSYLDGKPCIVAVTRQPLGSRL